VAWIVPSYAKRTLEYFSKKNIFHLEGGTSLFLENHPAEIENPHFPLKE
jgi:hypothetical protein